MWEVVPFSAVQVLTPLPFDPLTLITGSGGFWRADMGITLSGSNVTNWADQSSFGNNLSVGAGGQTAPTFNSTGFNSTKNGVVFPDGGGGGMQATSFNFNSTTCTAFILFQWGSAPSVGFGRFLSLTGAGNSSDTNNTQSFATDQNSPVGNWDCGSNGVEQGNGGAVGPALTGGNLYLIGQTFDGANANRWSAGSVLGSATANTNTIGGGNITRWCIGFVDTQGSAGAGFTCAFFGLTTKAMNSTDWTNLKNWSNSNWGTSF